MSIEIISVCSVLTSQPGRFHTTLTRNSLRGRTAERSNSSSALGCGRGSRYTGSTSATRQFTMLHKLQGNFEQNLELLEALFYDPNSPCAGDDACEMVFVENGVTKTAYVVPVGLAEDSRNAPGCGDDFGWWLGTWELLSSVFCAQTTTTTVIPIVIPVTISSVPTGGTVAGCCDEYRITPLAEKAIADGQQTRDLVTIANRAPRPMVNWPTEIPLPPSYNGTLLEVYSNGVRIPHFFGVDRVFVNLDMPSARYWTLNQLAGAADTTLYVDEPLTNLDTTPFWIYTDLGEVLRVTDTDAFARTLTVVRGDRDSSATPIAVAQRLWLVPKSGLIDIVWGYAPVGGQVYNWIDPRYEPICDVNTSNNITWDVSSFYTLNPSNNSFLDRWPRGGSFKLRSLGQYDREHYQGDGDMYTRYIPSATGSPATSFGLDYNSAGAIVGRPIADRWDFDSPIGIASATFDWDVFVKYSHIGLGPLKTASMRVYGIDHDGNEELLTELDFDSGGPGTTTVSVAGGFNTLSFRIYPWDIKLRPTPGTGIPLEFTDTPAFVIDNLHITYSTGEQIAVVAPNIDHRLYQIGRPDVPAKLSNGATSLNIYGILIDVTDTLTITPDPRSAVNSTQPEYTFGHLIDGNVPCILADLSTYPLVGTAVVTFSDDGSNANLAVDHRDAWN